MPEASQEGSLRGFKSYKDVTTFHYTIPKEVYRATWKFAAFMDDKNCLPRKVYMSVGMESNYYSALIVEIIFFIIKNHVI